MRTAGDKKSFVEDVLSPKNIWTVFWATSECGVVSLPKKPWRTQRNDSVSRGFTSMCGADVVLKSLSHIKNPVCASHSRGRPINDRRHRFSEQM